MVWAVVSLCLSRHASEACTPGASLVLPFLTRAEQETEVASRWYVRGVVFICAVATEICTWSGILFAGKGKECRVYCCLLAGVYVAGPAVGGGACVCDALHALAQGLVAAGV